MTKRGRWSIGGALTAALTLSALLVVVPAGADHEENPMPDCNSDLGNPQPATPEWNAVWDNTEECRQERAEHKDSNPAYNAAAAFNAAQGSTRVPFGGDPFRDTDVRWAGIRGEYTEFTWLFINEGLLVYPTDVTVPSPVDTEHVAALLRPTDPPPDGQLLPGIIWLCHSCFPRPINYTGWEGHIWVAQTLAEHGYLVLMVDIGGNSVERAQWAIDFMHSTPDDPAMPLGVGGVHPFNPWHALLDRNRLGLISHSGGAGVAMNVGNSHPDVDAVVAYDRAGSFDPQTVQPSVPTLMLLADLSAEAPPEAKPTYAPGSKFADFDAFEAAGVDAMKVSLRSATHVDFLGVSCTGAAASTQYGGCAYYSEQVAAHYTLAWFDRYVRGSDDPAVLQRLTGTDTFDGSSDPYSIGTGYFDPEQAVLESSAEAGNVPITIGGISVCNRLSFWWASAYYLDGGSLQLEDMRASCYDADLDGILDELDNCPFVANPDQLDSGGIDTSDPDGIGDACQCGDVTGNGIVNGQDGHAISRHGIGAEPNPTFVVPGNCDVSGNDACNGQDGNAVRRAALGAEPNPLFGQRCHNATGEPLPPGL